MNRAFDRASAHRRQHPRRARYRRLQDALTALRRVGEAVLWVDSSHVEDAVNALEGLGESVGIGQVLDLDDLGAKRLEVRAVLGGITHGATHGVAKRDEVLDQRAGDEAVGTSDAIEHG